MRAGTQQFHDLPDQRATVLFDAALAGWPSVVVIDSSSSLTTGRGRLLHNYNQAIAFSNKKFTIRGSIELLNDYQVLVSVFLPYKL